MDTPEQPTPEPTPTDMPKTQPPATPEPQTFTADYVKQLRDEAAANRVKAKEAETAREQAETERQATLDAIARALGLNEQEPPDPEELARQLTAAQEATAAREAELRQLRVERAAERAARTHDADVDTLLDSRAFTTALAKLDPSDEGFADALDELVKTTVEANPKYKLAGQAPTTSSADFAGGTGEKRTRPTSLYDAVTRTLG
ncbi:hypothetical protein GCM10027294_43700 [Marinactinospora endophytica]